MSDYLEVLPSPQQSAGELEILPSPPADSHGPLEVLPSPSAETIRRFNLAKTTTPEERYNATYGNTAPTRDDQVVGLDSQNATVSAPREVSLLDRVRAELSSIAAPVVGQSPESALKQYQSLKRLPEGSRGISDKQLDELFFDSNGNLKEDRLKAPLPAALARGVDQLQSIGYGLAQWMATMAGIETPNLDKAAQANKEEIQDNPGLELSAKTTSKVGNPLDLATYAVEKAGENATMMLPGLAGGAAAGRLATVLGASPEAAAIAQGLGVKAGSIGTEIGSIFGDMVDSGKRDRRAALIAGAAGTVAGLIESLGEAQALGKITSGKVHIGPLQKLLATKDGTAFVRNGIAKVGDSAMEQFLTEAPTEAIQTAIEEGAKAANDLGGADKFWSKWWDRMTSPETQDAIRESGIAGAIAGGGIGAITAGPTVLGDALRARGISSGLKEIDAILAGDPSMPVKPGTQLDGATKDATTRIPSKPAPLAIATRKDPSRVILTPAAERKAPVSQAKRRGSIEAGLTAPQDSGKFEPEVEATTEVQPQAPAPEEAPVAEAAPVPQVPEAPLKTSIPEAVQPMVDAVLSAVSQAEQTPEFKAATLASASHVLPILQYRYEQDVAAGVPELAVQPIEDAYIRIQRWVEANRPAPSPAPAPAPAPVAEHGNIAGFTTAKGSTYVINPDGSTTRNKAARPEHPGEVGVQKPSLKTWYVTPEQAQALGEIQAQGYDGIRSIEEYKDTGWIGMKYVTGPRAGTWERRTMVNPQLSPAVGLMPVESWGPKSTVHFGNEIVSLTNQNPEPTAAAPAPTPSIQPPPVTQPVVTPPAPPVAQPVTPTVPGPVVAKTAPAPVEKPKEPELPPVPDIKEKLSAAHRQPVAPDSEETLSINVANGVAYLNTPAAQEAGHPEAVAEFQASPLYTGTISNAAATAPKNLVDPSTYIEEQLLSKLFGFIANRKATAFKDGKLDIGTDGFSLQMAVRSIVKDMMKSSQGKATKGLVSLDADASAPAQARIESEAGHAADDSGNEIAGSYGGDPDADPLGVRQLIYKILGTRDPGVDYAIKEIITGKVNRAVLPANLKPWVDKNSEQFKSVVAAISKAAQQIIKAEGATPSEVRESLSSIYLLGSGAGMSVDEATKAITQRFGALPSSVRVVSDPSLRGPDGQPVKGVFASGRSSGIVVNAANLSGPLDAVITVLHEAIHAVWEHAAVRSAAEKLMALESSTLDGYSPDQVREELAVRAITDQWSSDEARSMFRKLADAVWSAVKRLVGYAPTSVELRRQVLAQAIRTLKNQSTPGRSGVVRYSFARQVFKTAAEVNAAAAVGNQAQIKDIAAAQQKLVEPKFVQQIQSMMGTATTKPTHGMTKPQRAAIAASNAVARATKRAGQMLRGVASVGSLTTLSKDLATVDRAAADVAALAIVKQADKILSLKATVSQKLDAARERLKLAQSLIPKMTGAQMAASASDQLSKSLVSAFSESIAASNKLGPSLPAAEAAKVTGMRMRLGELKSLGLTTLQNAIRVIAEHRPPGADTAQWLAQQAWNNWAANGGTPMVNDTVLQFLLGFLPATVGVQTYTTNLSASGALNRAGVDMMMDRIHEIITDKKAAKSIVDNVDALFKSMSSAGATPLNFARQYAKAAKSHAQAMADIELISGQLKSATEAVGAYSQALDVLDQIEGSKSFKSQVEAAVAHQGFAASVDPVTDQNIQSIGNGGYTVLDPITKKPVFLSNSLLADYRQDTLTKVEELLTNIEAFLTDPNVKPDHRQAYEEISRNLRQAWLVSFGAEGLAGNITPVIGTSKWIGQLLPNIVSFAFIRGITATSKAIFTGISHVTGSISGADIILRLLPGPAGRSLHALLSSRDLAENLIGHARTDPTIGHAARHAKLIKLSAKHPGVTASERILAYSNDVLETIFRHSQNPGQREIKPGDVSTSGTIITQEDIDVAKLQKAHKDYITNGLIAARGGNLKFASIRTEMDKAFRRAVDYGLKMPRRISHASFQFVEDWVEALEADLKASTPQAQQRGARLVLLQDPDSFNRFVNDTVRTDNPEWKSGDATQAKAYAQRRSMPTANQRFLDLAEFSQWVGKARFDILTAAGQQTTLAAQVAEAERVLVADLDRAVTNVNRLKMSDSETENSVLGVGKASVSAVSGRSSLTEERVGMIAPDGFYSYTLTTDADFVMFYGSVQQFFAKLYLNQMENAIKALESDRAKMLKEQERFITANPRKFAWQSKREFAVRQQSEVEAGKRIITLRTIDMVIRELQHSKRAQLTLMRDEAIESAPMLRVIGELESAVAMPLLLSAPVFATNVVGQTFLAPAFTAVARANGLAAVGRILSVFGRQLVELSKVAYSTAISVAFNNKPMLRMLNASRSVWSGLANHIIGTIAERDMKARYLDSFAGFNNPMSLRQMIQHFNEGTKLSATSGVISEKNGSTAELAGNIAMYPARLAGVVASFTVAQGDAIGMRTQTAGIESRLDDLRADLIQAMSLRDQVSPVDPNKAQAPFMPEEIGESTYRGLEWLRKQLAPAGSIEGVATDLYLRFKADPNAPLFSDDGMKRDVVTHILGMGNPINASSKGEGLKGKGWSGFAKRLFGRFTTFPIHLTNYMEEALKLDIRDSNPKQLGAAVAVATLVVSLAALAAVNYNDSQWLRQLQNGKVPSTPTVSMFASEGPAGLAKLYFVGGASLFLPVLGERAANLVTGQSQRDPFDVSSLVPGFGFLNNVKKLVTQTIQTGDASYPLTSFIKSVSPQGEMILNRLPGGQADLEMLNASRALRSSATSDMETRQPAPGAVKLSPTTPDIKDALRAATVGDEQAFNNAIDNAVAKKVASGLDRNASVKSVISSIRARNPESAVFGKPLTPEEREKLLARMTDSQREAVVKAGLITDRIKQWTGTRKRPGSLRRRAKPTGFLKPSKRRRVIMPNL